jgi:hypothetical protein
VLAGNKDGVREREATFERANEFAQDRGIPYAETSALTGQAVATCPSRPSIDSGGASAPQCC